MLAAVGLCAHSLELDLDGVRGDDGISVCEGLVAEVAVSRPGGQPNTHDGAGQFHRNQDRVAGSGPPGIFTEHACEPLDGRIAEHGVRKWLIGVGRGDDPPGDGIFTRSEPSDHELRHGAS